MPPFRLFPILIEGLDQFKNSVKNFVKSSFLSLVVLGIILLLLLNMDQALTLFIDMIEVQTASTTLSLMLSILFINLFALALSHYPIYTYYAANLNDSARHISWRAAYPFGDGTFKWYRVYIFRLDKSHYTIDRMANTLRYSLGMAIHILWFHYILKSFDPILAYTSLPLGWIKPLMYFGLILPILAYYILKRKLIHLEQEVALSRTETDRAINNKRKSHYLLRLGKIYVGIIGLCLIALLVTVLWVKFSLLGLILLYATSFVLIWNYVFFRLLRTQFDRFTYLSNVLKWFFPSKSFLNWCFSLSRSEKYLSLFHLGFFVSFAIIASSTVGSLNGAFLLNGIPVLMAFLYFYYFLIANLWKYYFVAQKEGLQRSRLYKILFGTTTLFFILFLITWFWSGEVRTHELDQVSSSRSPIREEVFTQSLLQHHEHRFFIASHGGGLKANAWTLLVLQELQKRTDGKLLNQTVGLSGASGGSLGLALYTVLYGENGTDFEDIDKKIDAVISDNYTSLDISLTFGLDTYRKLWPLNKFRGKDRPYFKMRRYQNDILDRPLPHLDSTAFRDIWKMAYEKDVHYPSLIMNTAATNGKRGISWSVKANDFQTIFPFSQNLGDLEDQKTLTYYQAVSTTNRFPFLSPAAKIKGYGHFIDAGAIDNSGLLSNLDLYNYFHNNYLNIFTKGVTFIEIINAKSLYADKIIQDFTVIQKIGRVEKDEVETDNIIADLKTGLNLDKVPGYLADYLYNLQVKDSSLNYIKIFLPHKINFKDIESALDGEISISKDQHRILDSMIKESNDRIYDKTEDPNKGLAEPWKYYEPTLSRHLNPGSIDFMKAMLEHDEVKAQFEEIKVLIPMVTDSITASGKN
ncbi:patatin-like phospholipase family protein [Aureitalea marina]|uniref:PNPLA domain-containing protein n=1 Tax=Aureitalea marina TaxID=930804 RepID=A0A2S7KNF7_9FLAO|nr:patatin-like phospholipase family protein [Aureitalea marina]PQB04166.1 hypothetical protein BST85_04055 [Aureitalea marina]